MAKEPGDRYQTVADLRAALDALAHDVETAHGGRSAA